jgi:hypothetical protein
MSDQIPEEFVCCDIMRGQTRKCSQHSFDCPDYVVKYSAKNREFYLEGVNATYILIFCPWCAKKVPENLREMRQNLLEKIGMVSSYDENIPEEYKTDAWWNKKDIK